MNVQLLLNYVPTDWSHSDYRYQNYDLVPLSEYSSTYNRISGLVTGPFNLSTNRIERVQNPFLYSQFLLRQQDYVNRGIPVTIHQLYHDTAAVNVQSIVSTNFDWRLSRRVKFGRGVSFSNTAQYANKYSSIQNGSARAMIVTDVIIGNVQHGNDNNVLPNDGYDTTCGNGHVYVKYYDDEFYPTYVVYYTSRPQQPYRGRGRGRGRY